MYAGLCNTWIQQGYMLKSNAKTLKIRLPTMSISYLTKIIMLIMFFVIKTCATPQIVQHNDKYRFS